MADIFNMLDTWNAGATVFTGIKLSVTDTASAAGSLLMDLQVGGVSQFRLRKDGLITMRNSRIMSLGSPDLAADWYVGDASGGNGFGLFGAIGFGRSIRLDSTVALAWNTGGSGSGADLGLFRDAANTLAQRNGVNAQAFNLYNTYTDASNYERGFMRFVSNTLRIGTEKLGTGLARNLALQTDGVTRLFFQQGGPAEFTVAGALYINGQVGIASVSPGVMRLINYNADGFSTLQLGLATTGFPALKVSTSTLQVRLGNDSAFTNIQGKLTTDTAYTAGAPTATGYIVLFDSAGTAYKVPAEAL